MAGSASDVELELDVDIVSLSALELMLDLNENHITVPHITVPFVLLNGKIKIGLVFGFCGCNFISFRLVSVCHFPENGISSTEYGVIFSVSIPNASCQVVSHHREVTSHLPPSGY